MPLDDTRSDASTAGPHAASAARGGVRGDAHEAPRSTGFMSTGFDAPVSGGALAAPSAFDVCHAGVVLRALLFVLAVLACGALFVADDWRAWPVALATGAGIALPGVLLWLLATCALRRTLGRLPSPAQWGAAIGLGALCGGLGQVWADLLTIAPIGPVRSLAPAAAGALLAGVVFQWLQLRARATLPADTRARLAELQSRIRPHFLFNTLNTALALVRVDPTRAEAVLEDLAELFRVAISDSAAAVTLSDEVELAQRYLAIEQIRFGARLQVDWDLDAAAGAARVPPLLLQPLVENAVRHGVEPADDGGVIHVRTRVRSGRAVLSITNSVPAHGSRAGHGMALHNVRERLHLMHDVAAHFESRLDGAVFKVQIVVPL